MDNQNIAIEAKNLNKRYDNGQTVALDSVSISLKQGKIYILTGSSGCGKSTLLNVLGTLDHIDNGEILYFGNRIDYFESLSSFRRENIGFVFQFHYLIPVLTLRENVESAMLFQRNIPSKQRQMRAEELLSMFGLSDKLEALAPDVSGGQRQRAAIARALANNPKIILADEPTGNVDSKTATGVMNRLRDYVYNTNSTILIATHDLQVEAYADVILRMSDGKIVAVEGNI